MGKVEEKSIAQKVASSIYRRESSTAGRETTEKTTILGGLFSSEKTSYAPERPSSVGGSTARGQAPAAGAPSTASPTVGGSGGAGGSGDGTGSGSGKRKIPCPNCTGESYNDKNGRKTSGIVSLLGRIGGSIILPILEIIQFILDLLPIPHIDVLGGKCGACGGHIEIVCCSDLLFVVKLKSLFTDQMTAAASQFMQDNK